MSKIGKNYYGLPLVADQQNNLKGLIQEIGVDESAMEHPRQAINDITDGQVRLSSLLPPNAWSLSLGISGILKSRQILNQVSASSVSICMCCQRFVPQRPSSFYPRRRNNVSQKSVDIELFALQGLMDGTLMDKIDFELIFEPHKRLLITG